MILVLSFFVLTFVFLTFGLLFSKVKINVKKLHFNMPKNELYKNEYLINIGIYLFGKIKIFGINLKNDSMKVMGRKINYEAIRNSKFYKGISTPEFKELDKKVILDNIKKIYIKFERFNLDLSLGTDSTLITSFLIFAVSTVISLMIQKGVSKYNPRKHRFIITPKYENYNLLNIDLDCIISLKMVNVAKMLIYINKISKNKEKISEDSLISKKKHYPGYV